MHVRARAALVTLLLNVLLTALKFAAFGLTGSLAILAEAWHSFGDIATSAMALLSVRRQARRREPPEEPDPSTPEELAPGEPAPRRGRLASIRRAAGRPFVRLWALEPEQKAALAIGLFLAGIGVTVLRKVLGSDPTEVLMPLPAGIAFLVFSLASYAVSRFELGVGESEGSPALIADGMHARADAVATFLTGLSLIAYHFGANADRAVAGLIGVIILSFAAETLVILAICSVRGERRYELNHRTHDLVGALADPRALARSWRWLHTRLDGGGRLARELARGVRAAPWVVGAALLLLYASTAAFTVAPEQQALVERFGRVRASAPLAGPGLHLKAPWPIDRVVPITTGRVRQLSIGNRSRDGSVPLIWTREHGTDEVFVSGDNNFFYPSVAIHYRVGDPHAFHYGAVEPERLLEDVALEVITSRFASRSFYGLALDDREVFSEEMCAATQLALDQLGAGIELIDAVVKDIHPPRDVARSFEGVVAAMQDHETFVNEAESYRNSAIPEARADAARLQAEARAYVADHATRSEGDAARFRMRAQAYDAIGGVTRERLYLEAMGRVLEGRRKVLVCPECGQPDIWLDQTIADRPVQPQADGRAAAGRSGGKRPAGSRR
jgi:modulator of FtsH protease HflK